MIKVEDKTKCCGCTACANICPKYCITMQADKEGFLYPTVDIEKCVDCGLCEKVCPILHTTKKNITKPKTYAIQLKNSKQLKESASGGAYSALSKVILKQDGIVWGAAYDESFNVIHTYADSDEKCKKFQGSKYVQSNLGISFTQVKQMLDSGILTCYSGTPCQIAGLKNFLKKDYDNLVTVDLVCAGVPSPKLWRSYLDMQEEQFDSKIKYANFRYKTYGYQCSTMRLEFESGKVYSQSGRIDPMMNFFVSGIDKRPVCYECLFKGENRNSDLTLFDGWHAEQLTGIKDNDQGFTLLMVHTFKGEEMLGEMLNYIDCYPVDTEKAILYDGVMVNNQPRKHEKRNMFYEVLNEGGIEACMKKFLHLTFKDYFLEIVKPVLYRSGLIHIVKRVKNRLHS